GSGNKTVKDSGIVAANVITDSGNLVNNNIVSGSGSKTVKDSAIASADVFLRTGSVLATGSFNMNIHNITNIAAVTFSNTNLVGTTPVIAIDNTFADILILEHQVEILVFSMEVHFSLRLTLTTMQ